MVGVAVQADGRVLVADNTQAAGRLTRFTADGRPDPSLVGLPSGTGQVVAGPVVSSDGKLIVGVLRGTSSGVMRLAIDGTPDPSFGTNGFSPLVIDSGTGLAVDGAGRVLVASFTHPLGAGSSGVLTRLDTGGHPDSSFGNGGQATGFNFFAQVAVDGAGRIIVGGGAGSCASPIVARYLPDGSLDPAFGQMGSTTVAFRGGGAGYRCFVTQIGALAVGPDGSVAVGAVSNDPSSVRPNMVEVEQLHPDGSYSAGTSLPECMPFDLSGGLSLARTSAGDVVVTFGERGTGLVHAAIRSDGTLDSAFGAGGLSSTDVVRLLGIPAARIGVAASASSSGGGLVTAGVALLGGTPNGGPLFVIKTETAPGGPGVTSEPLGGCPGSGYWLAAADGEVSGFGDVGALGAAPPLHPSAPIVGVTPTASGRGYWLVASDGGIFTYGDALFYGSTGALRLNASIVGMAATRTGAGYWLVASDGGIFSFGDATFAGSTGNMRLNQPVVGMAAAPFGGYWLVARDGGIFDFGDNGFWGSTGAMHLNAPIVGMAATSSGAGYWLVASDGGIFSFGDAAFRGSTGAIGLQSPIVAIAARPGDGGYWLTGADGGVFTFGAAPFLGSAGGTHLSAPIVGMAIR